MTWLQRLVGRVSSPGVGGIRSDGRRRRRLGARAPVLFDRACPDAFRRRLQASEPTLDCVYFGDGQWIIVVFRGDTARVREGQRLYRDAAVQGIRDLSVYQQAALMRDGWAGLYQFAAHEPTEAHALEALRRVRASWRDAERGLEVASAESNGATRRLQLAAERQDFIQAEARAIHRFSRRKPVSIIAPQRVAAHN